MRRLSDLLGRWRYSDRSTGAVTASCSWDRSPRLEDETAHAYGGPYMVCESAGIRGGTFLAGLPVFVAMVEDAAANDCMPAGFREDLRHALDTFFRPLVELREISFSEPDRGQEDVIEDLCRLRSLVNREVFGHQRAADCVCHKAPLKPEHFRDDGRVVAWIRAAVVEKIAEVKRGRARRRTTIVRPVP